MCSTRTHASAFWDISTIVGDMLAADENRLGSRSAAATEAAIAVAEFPRCVAFSRDEREKGGLNRP